MTATLTGDRAIKQPVADVGSSSWSWDWPERLSRFGCRVPWWSGQLRVALRQRLELG